MAERRTYLPAFLVTANDSELAFFKERQDTMLDARESLLSQDPSVVVKAVNFFFEDMQFAFPDFVLRGGKPAVDMVSENFCWYVHRR